MGLHHSTTFDRLVSLYDEYLRLTTSAELEEVDRWRCVEIRKTLDQLWEKRRAEEVFALHGPPRLISDNRPMSHTKAIAYGMAPLPSGGD